MATSFDQKVERGQVEAVVAAGIATGLVIARSSAGIAGGAGLEGATGA